MLDKMRLFPIKYVQHHGRCSQPYYLISLMYLSALTHSIIFNISKVITWLYPLIEFILSFQCSAVNQPDCHPLICRLQRVPNLWNMFTLILQIYSPFKDHIKNAGTFLVTAAKSLIFTSFYSIEIAGYEERTRILYLIPQTAVKRPMWKRC